MIRGVKFRGKVTIKGFPLIYLRSGNIIIGKNVTLNSSNLSYHANISKLQLKVDRKNSKIIIGNNTRIHGSVIHAWKKIIIGKNVLIAGNCCIIDSNGHKSCWDNPEDRLKTQDIPKTIIIQDNVWLGMNTIILKGTIIGNGSIVSANSVVKGNFPGKCLISGNPAKIIKRF